MEHYIVCEQRANHSRIHVKICQHRCDATQTCQAFQEYVKTQSEAMEERPDALAWPQKDLVWPTTA